MKWIDKFDLILFDFDGLLVNTEGLQFEAYRTLCGRRNVELPWDFNQYVQVAHSSAEGLHEAVLFHLQEKSSAWDSLYAEKKKIYLELLQAGGLKLMPGVESLLKELALRRTKRCVVTHSAKEHVEAIKHFLPVLKTIPVWITREDYRAPKPAPDGYLKAIEVLSNHGDRIIGFEDSLRGIVSLKGTSATPVLICSPKHPQMGNESLSDVIHYSSFEAIPKNFKG